MPSDKEVQVFLEALFNFKSNLYLRHFQLVADKLSESIKDKNKKEEALLRGLLDTGSRFTIDLYDVIDHATRDSLKESEIPLFWKNAKKTIEMKMEAWLQECVQSSPHLAAQFAKLRTDIREFQDRATKFHMERQAYTFAFRKAKDSEILSTKL